MFSRTIMEFLTAAGLPPFPCPLPLNILIIFSMQYYRIFFSDADWQSFYPSGTSIGHSVASVASVVPLLSVPQPHSDASRAAKFAMTDGEDAVDTTNDSFPQMARSRIWIEPETTLPARTFQCQLQFHIQLSVSFFCPNLLSHQHLSKVGDSAPH